VCLCVVFALSGCGTTERIISTSQVQTAVILIDPSPAGDVYLNGKLLRRSPVRVAIHGKRHKIERTTRKAGKHLGVAFFSVPVCTVIFPPAGIAVLWQAGQDGGLIETKREVLERDEAIRYRLEVLRTDYLPARIEIVSNAAPSAWRPTLELTATAKAERERQHRLAEAARTKRRNASSKQPQAPLPRRTKRPTPWPRSSTTR